MEQLSVSTRTVAGVHYMSLGGELDLVDAPRLEEMLVRIAGSTVVVDVSALRFIDGAGLGALVRARARIRAGGNEMVVRGAQPRIRRVFQLAGASDLLD